MGEPFMRELSSSSSYDPLGKNLSSSSSRATSYSSIKYSFAYPVSSVSSIIVSSKNFQQQASVISQNGMVHVNTPLQGLKNIWMFSPNGQLLFETSMDGTDLQFPWPRHLGAQNVILTVSQGKTNLYMGIVNGH